MDKKQQDIDETFMRKALAEAELARAAGEIPIGAVIACGDRIIARAHNLTETLIDVTAHAEMQAITMAANQLGGKYLPQCTLYVTVEPCTMCAGAIGWAQIGRLVYGADDEKRGFQRFAPNAQIGRVDSQQNLQDMGVQSLYVVGCHAYLEFYAKVGIFCHKPK